MRRLGNSLLTTGLNRTLGVKSQRGSIAMGAIRRWRRDSHTSHGTDQVRHRPVQRSTRVVNDVRTTSVSQPYAAAVPLCLFLGWFGIHRFYRNRPGTSVINAFALLDIYYDSMGNY